jgi:MAP/microtubule affinity-regulating kinase
MRSESTTIGFQAYPYLLDDARNAGRPFLSGNRAEVRVFPVDEEVYIYDDSPIEDDDVLPENPVKVIHPAAFASPELDSISKPEPTLSPAFPEEPISLSPAARFLSSFSPSTNDTPLPGSEGEVVSGYTLGPVIGSGGFSTIRRASSPTGGVVVVKIVRHADVCQQDNPDLVRRRLDNEAAIWSTLCHEHILPLFATSRTDQAQYFVTLYCPAGSLFDILKRDGQPGLQDEEVGMMFRQVVGGLRYLHETVEIVHGDIKLENVLVDEMSVCRIGDFGLSRRIGEVDCEESCGGDMHHTQPRQNTGFIDVGQAKRHRRDSSRNRNSAPLPLSPVPKSPEAHTFQPGSLPYASPELLRPRSSTTGPHPSQDIWALGIMLFALLTGHLPFMDAFEPRLQMKILRGGFF